MPVYNGLPHLKPAIESVLAQTYADFEFLIVNDASTDESLACIRSYRDPRIRLVENPQNLGTSRTMNRGIEMASGTYIARLDQDDVSMPRRIEAQLAYMEARPQLDITCTWEHGLDSDGRLIREWRTSVDDDGGFLGPLLMGICPIWHPSIMFKRQAMLDAGGFDPTMQPVEDFEVTMRLALKGYHAGVVPEFLVGQRDHNARQSVTKAAAQARRTQELHELMLARFASDVDIERLGQLLRLEEGWRRGGLKKAEVARLFVELEHALEKVRTDHGLAPAAFATLQRVVYRRLGPGARRAPRWRHLPAPVFFALLFATSPLLIPGVRPLASSLFAKLHRVNAQVRN